MKQLVLLFSLLTLSFEYVAASESKVTNSDKKIEGTRKPAEYATYVKLGDTRRGTLGKYIDPDNGTICYVATAYEAEGGVAMQCFKKD